MEALGSLKSALSILFVEDKNNNASKTLNISLNYTIFLCLSVQNIFKLERILKLLIEIHLYSIQ